MKPYQVNLTNCDQEPIHIPGKVQAHGFLVAVDNQTFIINFISGNAASFLGKDAAYFLNKSIIELDFFLKSADQNQLANLLNLLKNGKNADSINPYSIKINQNIFNLIVSASGAKLILEFEPASSDLDFDVQKTIGKAVSEVLSGKNLSSLLHHAAAEVKKIIQYDRVMIYKFNEEGHGKVVAEVKNDDLDPFLDLYYPATDIPKQARELYKINLTRIIADVNAVSSAIITFQDQDSSLDLSHSALRAVSPIHIQYLKNMGVASSFSISLMAKGELWGLVACHNYSPRFIDYKARDFAKLLGQILSSALEYRLEEEDTEQLRTLDAAADEISKQIKTEDNIVTALTTHPTTLKNLTAATGAVLIFNNEINRVGITPEDEQIKEIIIWLKTHLQDSVYYTNRLPELFLPAKKYSNVGSGMLACVISKELNEWLLWFKPEQIESITWAGNPEKPLEENTNGLMQLAPRKSFEAWTEIVKNTSEKWSTKEVSVVVKIREEILDSINRKANEIRQLNDQLQLAYDELDTFAYTISHDLRTPLSAIKSYSELLLTTNKSLDDSAKNFLGRIVIGADKMNFLIKEILNYSHVGRADFEPQKINMQALLENIKQEVTAALKPQNLEFTFGNLPDILGDKTMIDQVFTNLLNNAIKYSSLTNPAKVKVEGIVYQNETIYTIADNGVGIDINCDSQVFELFKRMDNVNKFEGTGVGLAIVKRIMEKHQARIWFESGLNIGTTFYLGFKN